MNSIRFEYSNLIDLDSQHKKSNHMTVESKLTDTCDVEPQELPEVPFATMMSLSIGYESNLNFFAKLSDTILFVYLKSKKP